MARGELITDIHSAAHSFGFIYGEKLKSEPVKASTYMPLSCSWKHNHLHAIVGEWKRLSNKEVLTEVQIDNMKKRFSGVYRAKMIHLEYFLKTWEKEYSQIGMMSLCPTHNYRWAQTKKTYFVRGHSMPQIQATNCHKLLRTTWTQFMWFMI